MRTIADIGRSIWVKYLLPLWLKVRRWFLRSRSRRHWPDPSTDPIRHVFVLMLENHSFDQMLGCFKEKYPTLDGVDPDHLYANEDRNGNQYQQQPSEASVGCDPCHEWACVDEQLA